MQKILRQQIVVGKVFVFFEKTTFSLQNVFAFVTRRSVRNDCVLNVVVEHQIVTIIAAVLVVVLVVVVVKIYMVDDQLAIIIAEFTTTDI
jgi:hypothetical protein